MRRKINLAVAFFLVLAMICSFGCTTTGGVNSQSVATGLAALHNALALAQVGYQNYALLAGKNADPKVQAAMGLIDSQLDVLGALAYNTINPSQADIDKANAALTAVTQAKETLNDTGATAAAAK